MEGRRRVKEQLKKMGSFEYHHTSFSYTDADTGEERFVGVPEQGGRDLISSEPMSLGTVYTASVAPDGTVGMFRVEVSVAAGAAKLRAAGGVNGATREAVNQAFGYMLAKKNDLGIGKEIDVSDLHVEVIDLLNNRVEGEIGLACLQFGECLHRLARLWGWEHKPGQRFSCRLMPSAQDRQREPMQVQPVWITILRHVAWLPPLGCVDVEVGPFQPGGLAPAARHHHQEPSEVAPDGLPQVPRGVPEPG